MTNSAKLNDYLALIDMSYDQVVSTLQQKYGPVRDDFFTEASYERYQRGEIKHPQSGKYKRIKEGLFTHHITEYDGVNPSWLINGHVNETPFSAQQSSALVYCDELEHIILHSLIVGEHHLPYGGIGFEGTMLPRAKAWYIEELPTTQKWLEPARKRAFLTKEEATVFFGVLNSGPLKYMVVFRRTIDQISLMIKASPSEVTDVTNTPNLISKILDVSKNISQEDHIPNDDELRQYVTEIFEDYLRTKAEQKRREAEREEWFEAWRAREAQIKAEQQKAWEKAHPLLMSSDFNSKAPRPHLLDKLFSLSDQSSYKDFKDFKSKHLNFTRDELLDQIEAKLEQHDKDTSH